MITQAPATDPPTAPACRVCGARRPEGTDQCGRCGASESECRRWRRRSDARWELLRRRMLTGLAWFALGIPLPLVVVTPVTMWVFANVTHLLMVGDPKQELPATVGALGIVRITRVLVMGLGLGASVAGGVMLDRIVRRLPTWNMAPWPLVGRIPATTLLFMGFYLIGDRPWWSIVVACTIGAAGMLATIRLSQVARQMDRWVEADRRAATGSGEGGPVRLPWYRDLVALRGMLLAVPVAVLGGGAPLAIWSGAMVAWCDGVICARRALRRWLDA